MVVTHATVSRFARTPAHIFAFNLGLRTFTFFMDAVAGDVGRVTLRRVFPATVRYTPRLGDSGRLKHGTARTLPRLTARLYRYRLSRYPRGEDGARANSRWCQNAVPNSM